MIARRLFTQVRSRFTRTDLLYFGCGFSSKSTYNTLF